MGLFFGARGFIQFVSLGGLVCLRTMVRLRVQGPRGPAFWDLTGYPPSLLQKGLLHVLVSALSVGFRAFRGSNNSGFRGIPLGTGFEG